MKKNEIIKAETASLDKIIFDTILECSKNNQANKINSDYENLMLFMHKTPKIISLIKKIHPSTILVGFKLLSNVKQSQLLNAAYKLMDKNNCDFVLANDLCYITESSHTGFLISPDKTYERLTTKEEVAKAIAVKVIKKYGKENSI